MSINRIKVNTDSLQSDVTGIAEAIGRIETRLGELEAAYAALDAMWDSPAGEIFRAAYCDDMEALKTIIQNLKSFNGFEVTAVKEYNACEQQVGGLIASMRW